MPTLTSRDFGRTYRWVGKVELGKLVEVYLKGSDEYVGAFKVKIERKDPSKLTAKRWLYIDDVPYPKLDSGNRVTVRLRRVKI